MIDWEMLILLVMLSACWFTIDYIVRNKQLASNYQTKNEYFNTETVEEIFREKR